VTRITVEAGKVVRREYEEAPLKDAPEPERYVEEGDSVGKHALGAPPLTMEAIYQKALELAGKRGGEPGFSLSFCEDGLLRSCRWIDPTLTDHAPVRGVSIHTLRAAGQKQ
jgi:hypothetical protein